MNQEYNEITLKGIGHLSEGTIFSLTNEHGRYKFHRYVETESGVCWIEAWGGSSGHTQFRAVRPDRVRKIEKK